MDPQGRLNNLPCPCYNVHEEFQKIVDNKDTGLAIYHHSSQKLGNGSKSKEEPLNNNNENMFLLHNTQDTDIESADIMAALDIYGISCPRCAYIINNAKKMLQMVTKIKSNNVMGICDHCRRKLTACMECDKVVKRFVGTKSVNKDKEHVLPLKSNFHRLLTDIIRHKKLFKGKKPKKSDTDIVSIHYNSPTTPQEQDMQNVYDKPAMKTRLGRIFTTDRANWFQSDLPIDNKRAKLFETVHSNMIGRKDELSVSRSYEDLRRRDNKTPFKSDLHTDKKIQKFIDPGYSNIVGTKNDFFFSRSHEDIATASRANETPFQSDLHSDKKRLKLIDQVYSNVVGKDEFFYSRSYEDISSRANKTLVDDYFVHSDYENTGNYNFGTDNVLYKYDSKSRKPRFGQEYQSTSKTGRPTKQTKQSFKQSKLAKSMPSMDANKESPINLRYHSEEYLHSASSSTIDDKLRFGQEPTSKRGKITKQTKSSLKESKLSRSMPDMKKKERGLTSPKYNSKELLSAISKAIDDTQYTDFNYYFPKEMDTKSKKPVKMISSSELISDTQNMLREKAEKEKIKQEQERIRKQEEKERQKIEKIEQKKAYERILAEEQARKVKEEAKQFAEEKRRELIIRAGKHQMGVLSTLEREPSQAKSPESFTEKELLYSKNELKVVSPDSSEDKMKGKQKQKKYEERSEPEKQYKESNLAEKQTRSENELSKADEDYLHKEDKGTHTMKGQTDKPYTESKYETKRKKEDNIVKKEKTLQKSESERSNGDDMIKKLKEEKKGESKEDKSKSKVKKSDQDVLKKKTEEGMQKDKIESKLKKGDRDIVKKVTEEHKYTGTKDNDFENVKEEKDDKYERTRSEEGNKTSKKDNESPRRENKPESKKSKEEVFLTKTEKQMKKHGVKNEKHTEGVKKEKSDRPTTDKQKSEKDVEATTKRNKKESEVQLGKVDKAAADEFKNLLAADAKQREIDKKQKQIQEEEERKARAAADKNISNSAKSPRRSTKKPKKSPTKKVSPLSSPKRKSTAKFIPNELSFGKIKMKEPSGDDLLLKLVKLHQQGPRLKIKQEEDKKIRDILARHKRHQKIKGCLICTDSDLQLELESLVNKEKIDEITNIIIGEKIYKYTTPIRDNDKDQQVSSFKAFDEEIRKSDTGEEIKQVPSEKLDPNKIIPQVTAKGAKPTEQEPPKGIVRYALSDRSFINRGWTLLPTEKVVRKMNVYRMRPAHPEFDWFEHNKSKRLMQYDSGEKLAEFDDNGRGRWFYKNGRVALDYYDAEETNAQQRFVIYSSGEPDERGRSRPLTILATFDYLGNGVVFDHAGKIRLKYNQTEGVVLDRSIGPVSHWKWHTLNDPPVLQQVMIDTQMPYKDPTIMKLGKADDNKARPDNEEMLAIEFDNFIKEKSKKLSQSFKPFQIKMKALKINEQFSLKVLDQATVYLIFRDGTANLKLNLGMILDHKEIMDTDTAEVGEVSNTLERLPARTDSIAGLQSCVAHAQHTERLRAERERRLRPVPSGSADRLAAAASRPLRPPFRTVSHASAADVSCLCKCRKPSPSNVYYDTRLV